MQLIFAEVTTPANIIKDFGNKDKVKRMNTVDRRQQPFCLGIGVYFFEAVDNETYKHCIIIYIIAKYIMV